MRVGILFALSACLICCSPSGRSVECDFAGYKPLEVPPSAIRGEHSFFDPRTNWAIKPIYPPEAKERRLAGTVHVRVLIDMSGSVVKTCAVFPSSESRPDESLVRAAVRYVEKGRFRRNFGQPDRSGLVPKYAATTFDIHYTLADQHP